MEIARHLVLGTAHIAGTTAALLDNWAELPPMRRPLDVGSTGYGWFVSTCCTPDSDTDVPSELLAAIIFARKRRCTWLLLDRDADTILELPTFDW